MDKPVTVYAHRDPRVPTRAAATVTGPDNRPWPASVVNLSRSGMRIKATGERQFPFPKTERVQVALELPFWYGDFSADGEVIWTRNKEGVSEIGIRFKQVDAGADKRLNGFLEARPVEVLFVGAKDLEPHVTEPLQAQRVFPRFVTTDAEAFAYLAQAEVASVIVGQTFAAEQALSFLQALYAKQPLLNAPSVVTKAGANFEPFAELVTDSKVYFLTQRQPPAEEVVAIAVGCIDRYWTNVRREEVQHFASHQTDDALFNHVLERSQAANRQSNALGLVNVTQDAVKELTACDRAYCLFHDLETETLWAPAAGGQEMRECATAAGIVAFAARTGFGALVTRADQDARYDRDADDPMGNGEEQLLVEPIISTERRVAAVLVSVRASWREPFTREQRAALRIFASQLTATFDRLVTQIQIDRTQGKQQGSVSPFSEDALQEYLKGQGEIGRVLSLHSPWIDNAFFMLIGFVAVAVLFTIFGRVNHYGQGTAIVRIEDKMAVSAKTAGVVTKVPVAVGQRVREGAVLTVLDDSRERAELGRIERDLEQQLIRWLRDPSDATAAKQIADLRAAREVALNATRQRSVVAPRAGTINDIRVAPGHVLSPGDTVASLTETETPAYSVLALFPGRYRPQAKLGSSVRLEFVGYPYSYLTATIASIGEEVVGPKEARRMVGPEHADSIALDGPVFVARAQLPGDGFLLDGVKYGYFDGLQASAEVRLRAEPIIVMLVPALRRVYDSWWSQ